MRNSPPYKCLFCLSNRGPFDRIEHPIPESLGNDDLVLDQGYVCDTCNQYFGAKVEHFVINAPPFGVERIRLDLKTKKGKHPAFKFPPHLELYPTPIENQVVLAASPQYWEAVQKGSRLIFPHDTRSDFLLTRMLLKIGLELLTLTNEIDPYDKKFNLARAFARAPQKNKYWQTAYGVYPRPEDLILFVREDDLSQIINQQLYQYEMGIMDNGDVVFNFVYRCHVFACNLSSPSIESYALRFNLLNNFRLEIFDARDKR